MTHLSIFHFLTKTLLEERDLFPNNMVRRPSINLGVMRKYHQHEIVVYGNASICMVGETAQHFISVSPNTVFTEESWKTLLMSMI